MVAIKLIHLVQSHYSYCSTYQQFFKKESLNGLKMDLRSHKNSRSPKLCALICTHIGGQNAKMNKSIIYSSTHHIVLVDPKFERVKETKALSGEGVHCTLHVYVK